MCLDVLPNLCSEIRVFALELYFGKIFIKLSLITLISVKDLVLFFRQI